MSEPKLLVSVSRTGSHHKMVSPHVRQYRVRWILLILCVSVSAYIFAAGVIPPTNLGVMRKRMGIQHTVGNRSLESGKDQETPGLMIARGNGSRYHGIDLMSIVSGKHVLMSVACVTWAENERGPTGTRTQGLSLTVRALYR